MIEQASENQDKTKSILKLYKEMQHRITEITHSQHAIKAVDFLFSRSIFASTQFIDSAGIPRPTAQRILGLLRDNDILAVLRKGVGRRAYIYAFSSLLNIAEGEPLL